MTAETSGEAVGVFGTDTIDLALGTQSVTACLDLTIPDVPYAGNFDDRSLKVFSTLPFRPAYRPLWRRACIDLST